MPTVYRQAGYRFFFFSNEGTEPAHIHVESSAGYAKYWLEPVALARSIGLPAHELTKIGRIIEAKAPVFKSKWNEYFGNP